MYDQFYGFTGRPFQLTPDPHYYFESSSHRKAMSYLGYGLAQREGMILITGEAGAGKSILIGHLLEVINPAEVQAVALAVPSDGADDFLILAAEKIGLDYQGERQADLLSGLEIYLRRQLRSGRRVLLIVDDAHNLSLSAMEQLLALSSLAVGAQPLMQIFMLGEPEFRQHLMESPSLEALQQRVIAAHHLEPMEAEEVEPYIFHRLSKVGWNGNPSISADAFDRLYAHSEGLPRTVNGLFSRLLLHGALEELPRITGDMVEHVVQELVGQMHGTARQDAGGSAPVSGTVSATPASAPPPKPSPADTGESPAMVAAAEYLALQHRVAKLEARVAEQDEALRRMINLLITWVDQQDEEEDVDPKNGPRAQNSSDFLPA